MHAALSFQLQRACDRRRLWRLRRRGSMWRPECPQLCFSFPSRLMPAGVTPRNLTGTPPSLAATHAELNKAKIDHGFRDLCASLLIPLNHCRKQKCACWRRSCCRSSGVVPLPPLTINPIPATASTRRGRARTRSTRTRSANTTSTFGWVAVGVVLFGGLPCAMRGCFPTRLGRSIRQAPPPSAANAPPAAFYRQLHGSDEEAGRGRAPLGDGGNTWFP